MLKTIKNFIKKFKLIDAIGGSIFFLILVVAALFFLRKTSYTYVTLQISKSEDMFNNLWFYKPTDWYLQNLKIGMSDKDLIGRTNLELTNFYYYPNYSSEQTVFVTIKVNAVYNKNSKQYSHDGKPLLVGEHRIFQIGNVSIPGVIQRISSEPDQKRTKKIIVNGSLENEENELIKNTADTRFFGVRNYLADRLREGLIFRDSKGNAVAEVKKVYKKPGYREFIYQNSIVRVPDPERMLVNIEIELTLTEVNGRYLFKEEIPILYGGSIFIPFEEFGISLKIEEIKEL